MEATAAEEVNFVKIHLFQYSFDITNILGGGGGYGGGGGFGG